MSLHFEIFIPGFMCSTAYLKLKHEENKHIELCPAAPVHPHAKGGNLPVYFSDIVVASSKKYSYFSSCIILGSSELL